jgi:hypothetical protein
MTLIIASKQLKSTKIFLGCEEDATLIAENLITAIIFWASSSFGYETGSPGMSWYVFSLSARVLS